MNVNGIPLRLNICNRNGECITVKTKRPLIVTGSVVEVLDEEADDLIAGIDSAIEELSIDTAPWEDNFDLEKLRKKNNRLSE